MHYLLLRNYNQKIFKNLTLQKPNLKCNKIKKISRLKTMMKSTELLWALDFDGVICDSVGESSISAWKAASKLWPELMTLKSTIDQKEEILNKMRLIRPVVETGYENIIQIRCLIENINVNDMINDWSKILKMKLETWKLNRNDLVKLFGETRDEWMEEDLDSWLRPNQIYPGIAETLKIAIIKHEVYIVTTKQERFTHALLKDMAGIEFPKDRIFSQTISGIPKTEVLELLQKKHSNSNITSMCFIEDKVSTLNKVIKDDRLNKWKLYLADWGYNTEKEREMIKLNKKIEILNIDEFCMLLLK